MSSSRVKGSTLSFLVDGVDHWADVTACILDGEGIERYPTCSSAPRTIWTRSWFDIEAIQSTDQYSFWSFLFEHHGQYLPFGYAPHGNTVPTEDQPHFTGILIIPDVPPRLGGSAGRRATQTFSVRLYIAQGPLRVDTPTPEEEN